MDAYINNLCKISIFHFLQSQYIIVVMSHPSVYHSRFSIIDWINDTLLLNVQKIEQLGSGNIYCQLLDAAYPQHVPLHKVKWSAKVQTEFLFNFKILQTAFEHLGIEKRIQMQKLSKAKYQDNLEFVQWLRNYIADKIDHHTYQPLKRRNYSKVYLEFANKKKFNVTLHSINPSINKQNCEVMQLMHPNTHMKSSTKSNSSINSIKSSALLSSRTSFTHLPQNRRKSIKPISVLCPSKSSSNMSCLQKTGGIIKGEQISDWKNRIVRKQSRYFENVAVIESGDEEQIF